MPLIPFHFGPAIALKALMPAYFSLSVFALSQILIDLEPLYFTITDQPPLYRFFHTYAGAGVICLICIVIGKPVGQLWIHGWNKLISPGHHSRLHGNDKIPFKATVIAAFIGAFSHVFLDSIMYADVHPLSPWSEQNHMLGTLNLLALHFGLIALGTVGAFWLVLMVLMNRFR
jgi:hypothetical protein